MKYLKSPYFYAWIGATIGSAVLMNVVNLFFLYANKLPAASLLQLGLLLLNALAVGAAIGLCQWLLLCCHFARAYLWILATAIGTLLSVFISKAIFSALFALGFAAATTVDISQWLQYAAGLDAMVVAAQWIFLRGQVPRAWRWILFSAIAAIAVPFLLKFDGFILPTGQSPVQLLLTVIVWGIFTGAITGIPMVDFIKVCRQRSLSESL
ncbi:MAG: hypothetical protein AAGL08_09245 [Cyanobacteria bacterium J06573_11]